MNRILYQARCRCKEESLETKKPKPTKTQRTHDRSIVYPFFLEKSDTVLTKTFQIRYDKKLSPVAKFILKSFRNKHIYYAMDDILYLLKSTPTERDNLLAILNSSILSLKNNFCIDFFDIWIDEIFINEVSKINKFLNNDSSNFEQRSYITIQLFYMSPKLPKKQDSLW